SSSSRARSSESSTASGVCCCEVTAAVSFVMVSASRHSHATASGRCDGPASPVWSGLPAPGSAGRCPFALPLRSRRVPLRLVALAPFRLRAPVLRGGLFLQLDRHTIVLERDPLALLRLRLLRLPLQVLLLSLGAG